MPKNLTALTGFSWKDDRFCCEELAVEDLAKRYGTPLYIYSRAALEKSVADYQEAVKGTKNRVFYAMKANASLAVLDLMVRLGCGFDIVSGGELAKALAAGCPAERIVYSGVGKTVPEIEAALAAGIHCFNVESEPELERINEVAGRMGRIAPIAFRVNPNVDAKTHPYISTGLKNNKFGIAYDAALVLYQRAASDEFAHVRVTGIDCHIGSQITTVDPFIHAAEKVVDIVDKLARSGIRLEHIDFGGGLGVCYSDETPPTPQKLVECVQFVCFKRGIENMALYFEPGRSLVANAGILAMTVQYVKPTANKNFCIVDAAMNDMIRPALYEAQMELVNTVKRPAFQLKSWDVVGPVCESSDFMGKDRLLSVKAGDVLAMTGAGAYGMSMASNYNCRVRPAEVIVDGDKAYLVRERESTEDLLRHESRLP